MTSTVKRKSMALVMALLLCFSMFVSFGTTAQAAGERSEIYMRKSDIKRFLAIYFDASMNGDQLPDTDGGQFFEVEQYEPED